MFSFLNYDNPIISGFFKLVNMVILSVLWGIFCLPVFTAGASTTALYYTVQKTIKHERGNVWPCFWQSFKQNFKQTTVITLIFLGVAVIFLMDISVLNALEEAGKIQGYIDVLFKILLVVLGLYAFWSFAYIARFQCTVKGALKNAGMMAIMHLPVTILIAVLGGAALFLIWLIPPILAVMPAISVLLMSLLTEKVFRRYMSEKDRELEDERNMDWREKRHSIGKGKI